MRNCRAHGYEVIGVSVNDAQIASENFIEKNELPFYSYCRYRQELVEQFGVWGEKKYVRT